MIIKPSTYFLLLLLFIHKSTSKLVKNYSNKLVHLDTISDETMSVNSGNEVPLFHSLLVHTNLIGKKIIDNNSNDDDAEYYVVSRSNDKVRQLWSTRTHTELRGAAPALLTRLRCKCTTVHHQKCVADWFESSGRATCPTCRHASPVREMDIP